MQKFIGPIFLVSCVIAYFLMNSDFNQKHRNLKNNSEISQLPFEINEVSEKLGITHVHASDRVHSSISNVDPWITAVGAILAIADVNNDGYQDIFLCNRHRKEANVLYINQKNGTFVNRAKEFGLGYINSPHPCARALFFDYNNDGRKDLFMGTTWKPKLFEQQENGKFIDVSARSKIDKIPLFTHAANVLDFDKDGYQDIIIASFFQQVDFYNPKTTKFMPESVTSALNGGPTVFYRNNGDGTFSDVTEKSNLKVKGWIFSVSIYDFNYDNYPDVWIGRDFNTNMLFLNNKDGTFRDISESLTEEVSFSGMSSDIADIDHDKKPITYITHIKSLGNEVTGNQMWKFMSSQHVPDQAMERNVVECGWGWGSKFLDLDNNGWDDIVVANGFISGDKGKDYWYHLGDLVASNSGILVDAKNWFDMTDYTWSGYEKNCLFYNKGGKFEDIVDQTELANYLYDARAVGVIDHLNNGSQSFVITNQNEKTLFFQNQQKNNNNWIGFRLVSRLGHPDVYGALIEVHLSDKVMTKQTYYNNGFTAQSDSRAHFGLGKYESIKKVVVRWPEGNTQEFTNLTINEYNELVEGKSVN